jgi:hypothetical protein
MDAFTYLISASIQNFFGNIRKLSINFLTFRKLLRNNTEYWHNLVSLFQDRINKFKLNLCKILKPHSNFNFCNELPQLQLKCQRNFYGFFQWFFHKLSNIIHSIALLCQINLFHNKSHRHNVKLSHNHVYFSQ